MDKIIISLKGVTAGYENKTVLREISLSVYERDFLGIIGPNGGGKTTLVKLILGLLHPTAGRVCFYRDGKPVSGLTMGYLPQYNSIDKKFPISVREVVLSGLSGKKPLMAAFTKEQKEQVEQTVVRMGLEGFEDRPIGKLSGGQLQRALLGRAIVSRPDVVILDEPSTYIDKQFEARLYELLEEINKEHAIILVSHDIGTVLQNVKSVACVNETLDYHPQSEVNSEWIEENFQCPFEVVAHGRLPHRILKHHDSSHSHEKKK